MLLLPALYSCHKGPKIEFEKTAIDLGKIEAGQSVSTTFRYRNTGSKTLKITHVDVECECTNATNVNDLVEPGKFGEIRILYKSSKLSDFGEQFKSVSIQTNGIPKDVLLHFKVRVINDSLKNILSKPNS